MASLSVSPGVELHYYDDDFTDPWRQASAILLQHGFSRSGKFWYNWVPLLSREFRVLRPDLRGMGGSSIGEEAYEPSLDVFMADLNAILDRLGIDRVVYVGESFGGILGLSFAHVFPEQVRALVLCNTPCRLPRRGRSDPASEWQTAMRQSVGTWSTATIDNRLDTRVAPEGMKDWYISEMDRTSPSIGRKLQAYLDTLDFRPYLKEVANSHPPADWRRVTHVHPGATAVHGRRTAQLPPGGLPRPGPWNQRHLSGVVRGPDSRVPGAVAGCLTTAGISRLGFTQFNYREGEHTMPHYMYVAGSGRRQDFHLHHRTGHGITDPPGRPDRFRWPLHHGRQPGQRPPSTSVVGKNPSSSATTLTSPTENYPAPAWCPWSLILPS